MPEEIIRLENLTKTYRNSGSTKRPVRAVDNFSLKIFEGETFGLVGESGCGKSTTGNILLHLLKPDDGKVFWRGTDVTWMPERTFSRYRREMQMVFQDPYGSINPRKKIGWLLEEPLRIHCRDMDAKARHEAALSMLREVGLSENFADRYPRSLSGGQRQRVSIALALILNPSFIVADEPVSALDVSVQAQILNLLGELKDKRSLTMLFISHDLNVISYLSDRIGVMYLGCLVEVGTQEQIMRGAAHPYTRALFAASDQEEGEMDEELVLKGEIPSPSHPPDGCPFHTRCPRCTERCRREKPFMRQLAPEWQVSCHDPVLEGIR